MTSPVGGSPGRRAEPHQEPAGAAQPLTSRSGSDPQSPWRGCGGEQNQSHGQSAAAPVPSLVSPLGGGEGQQGAVSVRVRYRADGGPEAVAWLPRGPRG